MFGISNLILGLLQYIQHYLNNRKRVRLAICSSHFVWDEFHVPLFMLVKN